MRVAKGIEEVLADGEISQLDAVLLDELPGYAIFTLSPDGVINSWNPGVEKMLGYSADAFLHCRFDLVFDPKETAHGLLLKQLERAHQTGRATSSRWYQHPNGGLIHLQEIIKPLRKPNSAGETGYLVIIHDDTSQADAAVELARSERNYRFLAESIPEIVWTAGPDGAVDYYNLHWYRFTGLTPDRSLGQEWQAALHPDDRDECVRQWRQSVETGEPLDIECRFRNAAGGYCSHLRRAIAQKDERGQVMKWFGTCTDIDDQKQAEKSLREAAKLESIEVLAAGMAHDFNNLLTAILGNISLAQEILPPLSLAGNSLKLAVQATNRAAELTQQLLAFAGKARLVLEPVNTTLVIEGISGLLKSSISRGIELDFRLAPGLPLIDADANQLQQIVLNLVINAAEAIGETAGTISIVAMTQNLTVNCIRGLSNSGELRPGTYVRLEVRDTGCGMDDVTAARVFDPFFTTKFTGRGLGLAAVLGIVRSHRGYISVLSNPGQGSTFRLLFPVSASS